MVFCAVIIDENGLLRGYYLTYDLSLLICDQNYLAFYNTCIGKGYVEPHRAPITGSSMGTYRSSYRNHPHKAPLVAVCGGMYDTFAYSSYSLALLDGAFLR